MPTDTTLDKTDVGNYFIANYPPFSAWQAKFLPAIESALARPSNTDHPLGLYLHIPFCRKRCKFCYFRVYTDVNAPAIQQYVDALAKEIELLAPAPALHGRTFRFVYFGGGTPSFLGAHQLEGLVAKLRRHIDWDNAEEVTFECEPGTLSEAKIRAIKNIGVTRLSLGVENFSDQVLEENGRAHLSAEVYRSWDWIKSADFRQINVDLIAGMVGETTENWRDSVRRVIELDPDSVTIYQLELPYNTRYSKELTVLTGAREPATWSRKREWLEYAYETLSAAGYEISSAYTLVKRRAGHDPRFLYRDSLWRGADMLGAGVASFGYLSTIHYQNVDKIEDYQSMLESGRLPLGRAYPTSAEERFVREMILQLKLGKLDVGYFLAKFGHDLRARFAAEWNDLVDRGFATVSASEIRLTRDGLLRVDSLLPAFFASEHRSDRYT